MHKTACAEGRCARMANGIAERMSVISDLLHDATGTILYEVMDPGVSEENLCRGIRQRISDLAKDARRFSKDRDAGRLLREIGRLWSQVDHDLLDLEWCVRESRDTLERSYYSHCKSRVRRSRIRMTKLISSLKAFN